MRIWDELQCQELPPKGVQVIGSNPTLGIDSKVSPDAQRKFLTAPLMTATTATPASAQTLRAKVWTPSSRLRVGIAVSLEYDKEVDLIPTVAGQLTWSVRPYRFNAFTKRFSPLQLVRNAAELPDSWEADSAASLYLVTVSVSAALDLTGAGFTTGTWTLTCTADWEPNLDLDQATVNSLFERCNLQALQLIAGAVIVP